MCAQRNSDQSSLSTLMVAKDPQLIHADSQDYVGSENTMRTVNSMRTEDYVDSEDYADGEDSMRTVKTLCGQ